MEYLRKAQECLTATFVYSNDEKFSEEFLQLLRIFYFFGFYRAVPSTKRTICGVFSLVFVLVSFFLGYAKNAHDAFEEDDMKHFMTSVPYTVITFALVVQTTTFMVKEKTIIAMIKSLHMMHEDEDEAVLNNYRKSCSKIIKFYTIFMEMAVTMVLVLHFCGYKLYELVSPTLVDDHIDGLLFALLFLFNTLQAYIVVTCMVTSDLLHVLCMIRAGANMQLLSDKLRRCTDSEDPDENEKDLVACVKYHQAIIEEANKIQEIFQPFFIAQVCGVLVVLTGLLYIVMNSTKDDAMFYLFGFVGLSASMFEIGTLCFFGQWLTSKSADLLDASYDCKWYNQSKSFKMTLIKLRIVCQREIVIKAFKFDFSRETFYWLVANTYSYYNNMSQTISSLGNKS